MASGEAAAIPQALLEQADRAKISAELRPTNKTASPRPQAPAHRG